MIELPEARVLAAQITESLGGRVIQDIQVNQSPHGFAFYNGPTEAYAALFCGKTLQGASGHGGHVRIVAEDAMLVLNDGMNLRHHVPGAKLPKKHQLLIQFEDGHSLSGTVQMYAGIMAYAAGDTPSVYLTTATTKPSPYEEGFTKAYFMSLVDGVKQTLSIKAFLATEQRIPGLGNGVLQDILFVAGVHPKTKLNALDADDFARIYQAIRDVLAEMYACGGRDTEKDLYGEFGAYKTRLSRKTLAFPCLQCGDPLKREAYLGGNIYYCSTCQPLKTR